MQICSRADAERELAAAKKLGVTLVALGEPNYPPRLQMIDDAPPLIAARGNARALSLPMVAIVGSRNASGVSRAIVSTIAVSRVIISLTSQDRYAVVAAVRGLCHEQLHRTALQR